MQNAAMTRDRRIEARLHKIWRLGAAKLVDKAFEGCDKPTGLTAGRSKRPEGVSVQPDPVTVNRHSHLTRNLAPRRNTDQFLVTTVRLKALQGAQLPLFTRL
jgi:hypothetical protein